VLLIHKNSYYQLHLPISQHPSIITLFLHLLTFLFYSPFFLVAGRLRKINQTNTQLFFAQKLLIFVRYSFVSTDPHQNKKKRTVNQTIYEKMAAVQLNFTLRTSSNCKTVHLIGSWDSYKSQLPLSKDSAKQGGWKGTFRFQGSTLKPGSRYWYYVSGLSSPFHSKDIAKY
jgi:hypothetical protein